MSLPNGVKRLCPICLFHCLFNHEPSSCYHELMVKMALCNCIQISSLLLLMFQPLHINQSYLVEETKCIKGQPDEFATQRCFFFLFLFHQRSHRGRFLPPETIKGSIIFRGRTGRPEKPRLAIAEVQDKGSATLW